MFHLNVGLLQIKVEGKPLSALSKYPPVRPHDPISIAFDETGNNLLFLGHVFPI